MDRAGSADVTATGWPFVAGEMAQRVRDHDWAATPLGAVQDWPAVLRTTVQLLLAQPFAGIVLWGPELVQIYNDAYCNLMGAKHPAGLGQPTRACWPEVWHINAPIYERVRQGESVSLDDALFPIARSGKLEDAWFSLTYSPVRDEAGHVAGVFVTIVETTRRLRAEAALRQTQARQAFLLCLSDALRPLQDAQAITLQATRLLGEHLGVNRAFYAEVRGDAWLVAKGYEQGVIPLPEGLHEARTYGPWIMAAYRAAQRIVFQDCGTDARFSPPECQAHAAVQVLSAVGVPLVKQGVLVAVLCVHSALPRRWSNGEVALVEETAERTWAAVERARAQDAQRQSEARLAMIFERALVGLSEIAPDGRFVRVNPELGRIVGRGSDDLLSLTIADVTHPDDVAISLKAAARVLAHGGSVTLEKRYRRPDGTLVTAQSSLTRLESQPGTEPRLLAVTVDLTERRQAEAALRESEANMRAIANLVPDLLWRSDAEGDIQWFSERWFEYTGQAPHEAPGQGWTAVIHPEDRAETQRCWSEAARSRLPYAREHRLRRGDGQYRWFLSRAVPVLDRSGRVALWFGSATDMHEQRGAREELETRVAERTRALQHAGELRRELLARVETLQDEERRRIARELHDTLGQLLSAMLLSVSAVQARLHDHDPALAGQFDKLQQLMQTVDHELDRIVFTLRPTALEDGGLGDAIAAHVATWSELTGQPVDLLLTGLEGRRLPPRVEAAVFRVVQEALSNIAKHARATSIGVSVERLGRLLMASIEDDGVGFDIEPAEPAGGNRPSWGLLGMRERIEALGGNFDIESHPGRGTTVLLRVPLH